MGKMISKQKNVEDITFELRFKSREIRRISEKSAKESRGEESRVRKAIASGDREGARIYAENAIRKKTESIKYLKVSSQFDAIASRLEAVSRSEQMRDGMRDIVPKLQGMLKLVDADRMTADMSRFEEIFETLDVRSDQLQSAVDATTASSTPLGEVDKLLSRVAEEHALDVSGMLSTAPVGKSPLHAKLTEQTIPASKEKTLEERLSSL